MLIKEDKLLDYNYSFTFKFDYNIVSYCQELKKKVGFKRFSFFDGAWRLKDIDVAVLLKDRYPEIVIDKSAAVAYELAQYLSKDAILVQENAKRLKATLASDLKIEGIKGELMPYQKVGVEFFINNGGKAILADTMGCLSGQTIVSVNRGGGNRKYTLEKAYIGFNRLDPRGNCGWETDSYIRSYDEEKKEFRLNKVKAILFKGEKDTIEIKAKVGKKIYKIELTPDHELIKANGEWTEAGKLKIGDMILTNGKRLKYCSVCKKKTEHASRRAKKFPGRCRVCIYKDFRQNFVKESGIIDKDGYIRIGGTSRHPFCTGSIKNGGKYCYQHVLMMEASLNNLSYNEWLSIIRNNKFNRSHVFIDSEVKSVHHINGIRTDNGINNLKLLSIKEHMTMEGKQHTYLNLKDTFIPREAKVISIKPKGVQKVYDIVMEDPHRNFIANGIVVHNCGKTLQALAYLTQTDVQKTLVICPATVKYNWRKEVKLWTDLKVKVIDSDTTVKELTDKFDKYQVFVINYDIIKKFYNFLIKSPWGCVIMDEFHYCFPYNTKVLTNKGYKKIGHIVEHDLNLSVASCNLSNNDIEYKNIVHKFKNELYGKMIKIKHQYGEVTCTANHRVWTDKGYKEAIHLSNGDYLSVLPEKVYNQKKGFIYSKILQPFMRWPLCKFAASNQISIKEETDKAKKDGLPYMQKNIPVIAFIKKNILRMQMCGKVEDVASRQEGKMSSNNKNSSEFKYREKTSGCVFKNEENESEHGIQKKDKHRPKNKVEKSSDLFRPWRKWKINRASKIISFLDWINDGISNYNKKGKDKIRLFAESLQSGFSKSFDKISNRNRRAHSQNKKMEIFRQKENGCLEFSRVESVEILEPGGDERNPGSIKKNKFVYNIEVADNNNYFANNVLVSNCKNLKAARTKYSMAIAKKCPKLLLLSGTPFLSRPIELFNGLHLMDPRTWSDYYSYGVRYCDAHRDRFGWNDRGASNIPELQEKISPYFLRRTKDEILPDLPKKMFVSLPVMLAPDVRSQYNQAEEDFARYLIDVKKKTDKETRKTMQAEKLAKLGALRMLTTQGKIAAAQEIIENIIDSGEKVVVFSCYNAPLEGLHNKFKKESVLLTGKIDTKERGELIDKFQKDKNCKIFFGGIKSAGVGITLTSATNVLFVDYSWCPADHTQAIDRIHRIGSTADHVTIYQLYSKKTVDEYMHKLLEKKQILFDQLIEGAPAAYEKNYTGSIIRAIERKGKRALTSV